MPVRVIKAAVRPFHAFVRTEALGSTLLIGATVAALLWANLGTGYAAVWDPYLTIGVSPLVISKPLLLWVNDFLMAWFFLLIGLEIKREVVAGELSSPRQVVIPAAAAVGGMVLPAGIFLAIAPAEARAGWAIPMATDIAFALGCLRLLGSRVPAALLIFLTAVAIIDDLGAILVIALFYTEELAIAALVAAAIFTLLLMVMNQVNVRRPVWYLLVGLPLWVAILKSGVHATLAGVIIGLAVPADGDEHQSPLARLEHALHPYVAFGVVPIFALANAGVPLAGLSWAALAAPLPLGIILGLFLGKQVGLVAGTWLVVRSRLGTLPAGVSWRHVHGASLLAGIGFTMALFIAGLGFGVGTPAYDEARVGVLAGSLLSGAAGVLVLLGAARREPSAATLPRNSTH